MLQENEYTDAVGLREMERRELNLSKVADCLEKPDARRFPATRVADEAHSHGAD